MSDVDVVEVEVASLVAVPLRHRLFQALSLEQLQKVGYERALGGPIARALKHEELAARVAKDILAKRVEEG
jgi:hypothetical protein